MWFGVQRGIVCAGEWLGGARWVVFVGVWAGYAAEFAGNGLVCGTIARSVAKQEVAFGGRAMGGGVGVLAIVGIFSSCLKDYAN